MCAPFSTSYTIRISIARRLHAIYERRNVESILKELKSVLTFYGLSQENVEQFERILTDQLEENADEVRDYLSSF